MEKLEKLLKEYAPNYCNDLPNGIIMDELVISKKFGFIKWLVENDKIDFELDRIIHKHKGIDFNTGKGIAVEKLCDKYESLLMLLSISSSPINDLISYLK